MKDKSGDQTVRKRRKIFTFVVAMQQSQGPIFYYSEYPKILNTFLLFSNKIMVIRAGIHTNACQNSKKREDPDQTASLEAV